MAISVKRVTKRAPSKPWRQPRRLWLIKPFDRIHNKKRYNRGQLRQELRRMLAELWEDQI